MEVITMSIVVGEYFRNMIPFSKPDEWNLDNVNNAINTIKFIKCKVPSMFGSQKPDHNLEKLDCQGSASKFIFGVDLQPLLLYEECLEC